MAEIIAIWIACKNIGAIARSRGLPPRPFQFRAVGLWIIFEIVGIYVGAMLGLPLILLEVLGLGCALISLRFSFNAVRNTPSSR